MSGLRDRVRRLEGEARDRFGKPVVVFRPDDGEPGRAAQLAQIEGMKRAGHVLIVVSDGDGTELWHGTRRVD